MTRHVALALLVGLSSIGASRTLAQPVVTTDALRRDVDAFFDREIAAHFSVIPDSGPLPERVHGAQTTGDFSWGTFVRALAAYAESRHTRTIGGRDVVPLIARVGVSESSKGSRAFAQLYAALALRHFGADLTRNPVWQSLSTSDRAAWTSLLDPTRFYDPQTRRVIDLPENYLGVAARVATLAFQMDVLRDGAFVNALLDRAAEPFVQGALYADDAGTAGRFDRYSNEYARYVYEAAETAGRHDIIAALQPSLTAQMRLWWDLVSPDDGYGYPWGRSLGVVSYLDTLEIVAFLAQHPALRPASLADLTSAYRLAWRWLCQDYAADRHMLSVFAPGRGNYAYITRQREWQQTVGFFGKVIVAHDALMRVIAAEKLASVPATPQLRDVARFEFFRRGDRPAGVWLVRQGRLRFALPITSGTTPGVADYLPSPHGLPGFAAPVEQTVPAGAPYLHLADGRILVPTDGADEITPASDGRSLRVTWRRFAQLGAKTGALVEPGFELVTEWRLEGVTLKRTETISASRNTTIRRLAFVIPSTATAHDDVSNPADASAAIRLTGPEGVLTAQIDGDLSLHTSIDRVGDEPRGRGARGAVPTHIVIEARDVELRSGESRHWVLRLSTAGPSGRTAQ